MVCSFEEFQDTQVWELHNRIFVHIEVMVIVLAMIAHLLFAIAIKKTVLLNRVTKVLTLHQWVGMMGYMPTRIVILHYRITDPETLETPWMLTINFIHDISLQSHYASVFVNALAISMCAKWPSLGEGRVCFFFLTPIMSIAWLLPVCSTYFGIFLHFLIIYQISLVYSIVTLREHLKSSARDYQVKYLGNLKSKAQISVNIRSIRLLSKITVFTSIRLAVALFAMALVFGVLPKRCYYREALITAQVHDIFFELVEVIIPVYLFTTEPQLCDVLRCKSSDQTTSLNALGNRLMMENGADDYFNQLESQWGKNKQTTPIRPNQQKRPTIQKVCPMVATEGKPLKDNLF